MIIDAVCAVARQKPVTFLFQDRKAYPDEVFGSQGFLPVLAMVSEHRLERIFPGSGLRSGFGYESDEIATFGQRLVIEPAGPGIHADSIRFLTLLATAEEILGLNERGIVDITPVYERFAAPASEVVDETSSSGDQSWPPYLVLQ